MNGVCEMARLRARSIAGDTFAIDIFLFGRTDSDTGSGILEQMFRALPDACCSISVFAIRILLPGVGHRIVPLHRGTLLLAYSIIIEVPACKAI